jgi:hypothetical protein
VKRLIEFWAYLWRSLKWAIHSLWIGYPAPRVEQKPYSRSYMRKAWAPQLRELDRQVNHWKVVEKQTGIPFMGFTRLLAERRIMVAKRRSYLFPD